MAPWIQVWPVTPHYLLGCPAMGRPASGVGMTFSLCRTHGLGGGATGSGGIERPLIGGMTTGFFAGREALRNVDVAIGAVGRPGGNDQRTHVIDVSEIGAFLGLDVGKGEHHATTVTGREEGVRQAVTQQRTQASRGLRQAAGQARDCAGDRGPAGPHRSPAARGSPGHGLPGRLSAGPDDAADRRPLSRRGQDRCPRRVRHRGRGPGHAAHASHGRARRRDHRRAGDDRRVRRRPG